MARSLGWAQQSAERADYAEALGWLQVIEAIGDQLPYEYATKREAWLSALAENQAR